MVAYSFCCIVAGTMSRVNETFMEHEKRWGGRAAAVFAREIRAHTPWTWIFLHCRFFQYDTLVVCSNERVNAAKMIGPYEFHTKHNLMNSLWSRDEIVIERRRRRRRRNRGKKWTGADNFQKKCASNDLLSSTFFLLLSVSLSSALSLSPPICCYMFSLLLFL